MESSDGAGLWCGRRKIERGHQLCSILWVENFWMKSEQQNEA